MQVNIYTPYPIYCPKVEVLEVHQTAKPTVLKSEWHADLDQAANVLVLQQVDEGATDDVLSYQVTQLMEAFAARISV